jgi:hypothetical protein
MDCPPLETSVTCTYCEPPRAADTLAATMDVPPAALLRFPSSPDPEALCEVVGWAGKTGSSRAGQSIPRSEVTWGTVGRGSSWGR